MIKRIERFIVTGTHAYGPARHDSDLDIVIRKQDVEALVNYLTEHNIETYQTEAQEDYTDAGFYFELAFIKINIIIAMTDLDFKIWAGKTERMKKLPAAIEDRWKRLETFNSIYNIAEAFK